MQDNKGGSRRLQRKASMLVVRVGRSCGIFSGLLPKQRSKLAVAVDGDCFRINQEYGKAKQTIKLLK
jgi:hypothetical protein